MKTPYLLSVITAVIGFSAAWLIKPATTTPVPTAAAAGEAPAKKPQRGTLPRSAADSKRPKEVKASDFPLADQADQGPKTRDEAKMLRLTEALGLSIDQQGAIIKLVEDVQATASGTVPVIQDLTTRGNAIEEGLAKLLTPEQLAKFQEIRVRERENRIELRSQRLLTQTIDEIDLSPEQREEVLDRLRQKSKAEMQAIPASATLLFDKSLLPTGGKELSADGILQLAQLGDHTPAANPMEAHQKVLTRQRQELEEILRCYDGILTPAQMGQYHASVAETREILRRIPKELTEPAGNPEPAPPEDLEMADKPDPAIEAAAASQPDDEEEEP